MNDIVRHIPSSSTSLRSLGFSRRVSSSAGVGLSTDSAASRLAASSESADRELPPLEAAVRTARATGGVSRVRAFTARVGAESDGWDASGVGAALAVRARTAATAGT